jgi:iduronate 2-sulfatase
MIMHVLRIIVIFLLQYGGKCYAAKSTKTNIIFITMDDMRPLINAYGVSHMITPYMDKLASKSVLFENAFCAVPVCCPSRNSMVTGLKPETIHNYGFENTFAPHLTFPEHFLKNDYNVAGFGKIYHANGIEGNNQKIGYGIDESKWYDYQGAEAGMLNSTVNPDRHTPEEHFRDYLFTSKAIEGLREYATPKHKNRYFFLALGFKLPHIHVHFPHKYYEQYRPYKSVWENVTARYLRFPPTAPAIAYLCCALDTYHYMKDEGNAISTRLERNDVLRNMTAPKPNLMYTEMMWAYSASISFLDAQIGRLMRTLDELDMWNNVTIVLTSDHGMNNGEKGLW